MEVQQEFQRLFHEEVGSKGLHSERRCIPDANVIEQTYQAGVSLARNGFGKNRITEDKLGKIELKQLEDPSLKSKEELERELEEEKEVDSLEEILQTEGISNIVTVKKSPYITLRELIEQIDEKPLMPIMEITTPEDKDRQLTNLDSFCKTLKMEGTFPLFFNREDPARYLTLAVRAHNTSNGELRNSNDLLINLDDTVLPFLKQKLKDNNLDKDNIEYILLTDREFDDVFELLTRHTDRASYLRKFTETSDANEMFYAMMATAKEYRASDIHIEPLDNNKGRIRYRIDGILHDSKYRIDIDKLRMLISFIKVKSNKMNISETRRPQDGSIIFGQTRQGDEEERILPGVAAKRKEIEELQASINRNKQKDQLFTGYSLRIATMPTSYFCEKMSLRIEQTGREYKLDNLGISPEICTRLRKKISEPHGIIIVTGPTGSGKTTTLYSILSELNKPEVNILTIEDPIEQNQKGLNQSQVNEAINWDFAQCLKTYMRHDPDIIFVGELRDKETALAAVRAAQTGHLTVTTLHTNDAHSVLERLNGLEIDRFDLKSSLIGVLSQRLVRKLCNNCKVPYDARMDLSQLLGKEIENPVPMYKGLRYERGKEGKFCKACEGYGYHGRTAVVEFWEVNDEHRKTLLDGIYDPKVHYNLSIKAGMKPIIISGLDLALSGETSLDELKAHLGEDDFARKAEFIAKAYGYKFKI